MQIPGRGERGGASRSSVGVVGSPPGSRIGKRPFPFGSGITNDNRFWIFSGVDRLPDVEQARSTRRSVRRRGKAV